ncbi:UNVERIFIED_CONTAM: FAA hydrolase family protein, partial [Microbacterium sp. SLM126]
MTEYVVPPLAPRALPVVGSTAQFPVARVFCIGRNYRWSPDEPAPREMPAWFMKPATAVEPARGALPYPPGTDEF